jgi:hypothetical protein
MPVRASSRDGVSSRDSNPDRFVPARSMALGVCSSALFNPSIGEMPMKASSKQTSRSESADLNAEPVKGNVLPLRRLVRKDDLQQTTHALPDESSDGDDDNPAPTAA